MAKIINGNILDVTRGYIVHQVNCQDAMGAGVARALYEKYPKVKEDFYAMGAKTTPQQRFGILQALKVTDELVVCNSYSQFYFGGGDKNYTDENKLIKNIFLASAWAAKHQVNCYIPYLIGCGLAGGNWEVIWESIKDIDNLIVVKLG